MTGPEVNHVHPTAVVDTSHIGEGTRIWAFAHVLDGARIGKNCNICDHVYIEGGVQIGDGVTIKNGVMIFDGVTIEGGAFIGPGVIFTNDKWPRSRRMEGVRPVDGGESFVPQPTVIRKGASLGAGAVIVCGTTIGKFAAIGAGAILTRDAIPHGVYVGNPARRIGYVCHCGRPLPSPPTCERCGRRYALSDSGLAKISSGPSD